MQTQHQLQTLTIEDGCVKHFFYEDHKRGKNWIACVQKDRQAPGGLARTFLSKASKHWYKLDVDLQPRDVLEFGADYYTGGGHPKRDRRYCVIVSITTTALKVIKADSAAEAFKIASTLDDTVTKIQVLEQELATLLARADELRQQIAELKGDSSCVLLA